MGSTTKTNTVFGNISDLLGQMTQYSFFVFVFFKKTG